SASLRCEETWTRYPALPPPPLDAICGAGLVEATRVGGSIAGWAACGESESGAVAFAALALAADGVRGATPPALAAAASFAAPGSVAAAGVAAAAGSPRTERVLIFR